MRNPSGLVWMIPFAVGSNPPRNTENDVVTLFNVGFSPKVGHRGCVFEHQATLISSSAVAKGNLGRYARHHRLWPARVDMWQVESSQMSDISLVVDLWKHMKPCGATDWWVSLLTRLLFLTKDDALRVGLGVAAKFSKKRPFFHIHPNQVETAYQLGRNH